MKVAKSLPLIPNLTTVEIAQVNGYRFIGRPHATPLKRLSFCDPERRRFLQGLLGLWAELPARLHGYLVRAGIEPNLPAGPLPLWQRPYQPADQVIPFHTPKRSTSINMPKLIDDCVRLMREGRLLVKSASPNPAFPASVLPLDWGDRRQSAAGEGFLYRRESLPGVSNRLHWPGGASGVTLGPGYDMKSRREDEVKNDMLQLGLSTEISSKIAKGATQEREEARDFCVNNRDLVYLSLDQEIQLMRMVLPIYEKRMNDALSISIKPLLFQNEIDSLISFTYNRGSLRKTKLVNYINSGRLDLVDDGFNQFSPGGDINRRPAEIALFTEGRYI